MTARTRFRIFLAAVALAGTVASVPTVGAAECPGYSAPAQSGRITDDRINEVSGLVAAPAHPGILWMTEDSGNGPWLYAITPEGEVEAAIEVLDAFNRDWEDMARGDGRVWIGDIGDNARVRPEILVYFFREPSSLDTESVDARVLILRYPDGAHNAEGMIVDGKHQRLFVFEKRRPDPTSRVYAADLRGVRSGDVLDLKLITEVPVTNVTAADIGRDGVMLKNNTQGTLFPWVGDGRRVARTLRRAEPCPVPLPAGESVAFSLSGDRVYAIPEGRDPLISYAARQQ